MFVPATARLSLPWVMKEKGKGHLGKPRGKLLLGAARDTGLALEWPPGAKPVLRRTGTDKLAPATLYRVRETQVCGC